jgi:hypothetical protein
MHEGRKLAKPATPGTRLISHALLERSFYLFLPVIVRINRLMQPGGVVEIIMRKYTNEFEFTFCCEERRARTGPDLGAGTAEASGVLLCNPLLENNPSQFSTQCINVQSIRPFDPYRRTAADEKGCNRNLKIVLEFVLAIIGKFVLTIDKRCFLLHGGCGIMRATVFLSDFLSSRIIPQDTVVTRFGVVELSEAILTRHGTRKGKTRPN